PHSLAYPAPAGRDCSRISARGARAAPRPPGPAPGSAGGNREGNGCGASYCRRTRSSLGSSSGRYYQVVVIIMKANATTAETSAVIARVEDLNLKVHLSEGDERTILGLIGDSRLLDHEVIGRMSGVDRVVPVLKPFKLAGRDFKPKDTKFAIGNHTV